MKSGSVSRDAVAAADARIYRTVVNFGGRAVMTAADHKSGTDRIAEAVAGLKLNPDDIVLNVQGDQPLFEPVQIDEVVQPLLEDPAIVMATVSDRIRRAGEITHPHAVKVVVDGDGFAIYFSRATIPYVRDPGQAANYYKHHGIYAYRRSFLETFTRLPQGVLERLEALEQLRAIEHGYKIKVVETIYDSVEVDTCEELARVARIIEGRE